MISLIRKGTYVLIETKEQTKILTLDNKETLAWVWAKEIGELLVTSHRKHDTDHILSIGKYRLYQVQDEPKLVDLEHIELSVGNRKWQGYLLPTGLPANTKSRKRIIPAKEIITNKYIAKDS